MGSHQVSAAYSGDSNFASSVSHTVVEVVSAATSAGRKRAQATDGATVWVSPDAHAAGFDF